MVASALQPLFSWEAKDKKLKSIGTLLDDMDLLEKKNYPRDRQDGLFAVHGFKSGDTERRLLQVWKTAVPATSFL